MTAVLEPTRTDVEVNELTDSTAAQGTERLSFTTRDLPWMKVGTVINDTVDSATAARLGGLDFEVELHTAMFRYGNSTRTVASRRAVVRKDTGEFFDFVSSSDYKPVQYAEAFAFLDQINPRYSAAGTLSGGKQGFMVVQLPDLPGLDIEVNGESDPHDMYVIIRTSHDRSKAIEVAAMPLRGKCMNMLSLPSFTTSAPSRWSIKHVGDVNAKLQAATDTLKNTRHYAEVFGKMTRQLASVRVDQEQMRVILKRVIKDRPTRDKQIERIVTIANTSDTVGFTGTGWGLLNAVSDYYQWGRNFSTRTPASVFTSGINGDTAKAVSRTAQLLLARA